MVFMKETRTTFSNLKCGNILPSGYFENFIFFLLKEKKQQSEEIYMKKYQKIHHPEGDSRIKFLSVVKATVFRRDFVLVIVVMELIYILPRAFWTHTQFSLHKICNYSVSGWLEVIHRDTENLFGRDWRGRTHMTHRKMYWALFFLQKVTVHRPEEHKLLGSRVLRHREPVLALHLGCAISSGQP